MTKKAWSNTHPNIKRKVIELQSTARVIDEDGCDMTHLVRLEPAFKAQTAAQSAANRDHTEVTRHAEEHGGFILAFYRLQSHADRFPSLKQPDMARLMYIGTYVAWESGRLQNGKHVIRKKDLAELLGMSRNKFADFYKRLISEGILSERDTGELFINQTVFYRGDLKNHPEDIRDYKYARVFRKTVRELYAAYNGRKLGQLAIIYSVLPFINFDTNILAYNPEESDSALLNPMPLHVLAETLGYERADKLTTALRSVKLDDKPVFGLMENPHKHTEKRVIVNPAVILGGSGANLAAIKALFN